MFILGHIIGNALDLYPHMYAAKEYKGISQKKQKKMLREDFGSVLTNKEINDYFFLEEDNDCYSSLLDWKVKNFLILNRGFDPCGASDYLRKLCIYCCDD